MRRKILHPRIVCTPDESVVTDALLIENRTVVALGDEARNADVDEVLRPSGAVVMPALHDAHIHMWGLGMRAGAARIRDARTVDEIYDRLRRYDPARSASGWVLARDWNDHHWGDGTSLSRDALDAIFPDLPVVLWRVDSHAVWANSVAIAHAGISDGWSPGDGGWVGRSEDGRLDGLFVDDAMDAILEAIPKPTVAEDREVFLQTASMLREFGICGAQLAWVPLDRVPFLRELHADGELPLHTSVWVDGKDPGIEEFVAAGPHRAEGLSIHTVKFFADGAMGSRGALMLEPYATGERGLVVTKRDLLIDRVRRYTEAGWDIAVHAIGDAAARNVLDAFDGAAPGSVCRLEHCQTMHPDDIERMGDRDRIASVQPIHMYSDAAWVESILSPQQLSRLFNWNDLQARAPLAAGSDFPIEDPNPWHGIATFVSRRDANGQVFRGDQAISRAEAIAAYTTGAASAAGWGRLGSFEPGAVADWIAVDTDPWTADADAIWDASVVEHGLGDLGSR